MMRATNDTTALNQLAAQLLATPADVRAERLQAAISFQPTGDIATAFEVGRLRALFAEAWEAHFGEPVPIVCLREALSPPVPIACVLPFLAVKRAGTEAAMHLAVGDLLTDLHHRVRCQRVPHQLAMFAPDANGLDGVRQSGRTASVLTLQHDVTNDLDRPLSPGTPTNHGA